MMFSGWLRMLGVVSVLLAWGVGCFGQGAGAAPLPKVKLLVQSPADTVTDLQVFCLFRSSAENTLHGSLVEIDGKLHGLLGQIRKPELFGGEFGETMVLTPPPGTLGAKRVLIIGLGDSAGFSPARMYLAGKIAWREANRLGVAHPFFAPAVLDGGVTKFSTEEVAEQVMRGVRDAMASEAVVGGASVVVDFTFLAGSAHAADTQNGINRAIRK